MSKKLEPVHDGELTAKQHEKCVELAEMIASEKPTDAARSLAKAAATTLLAAGWRPDDVYRLLPLAHPDLAHPPLQSVLLVDLLDKGIEKRLVMHVAVKAGVLSACAALVKNFNSRIRETRVAIDELSKARGKPVVAADLTKSAWEGLRINDWLKDLQAQWKAAGSTLAFGDWIETRFPADLAAIRSAKN